MKEKQLEEASGKGTTYDQIIDTALHLFAEQGYLGSSMNQIAKEAGVAKGTMYHYFESKEDLLLKVLQSGLAMIEEVAFKMHQEDDAVSKLKFLCLENIKMMKEKSDYWKLFTLIFTQVQNLESVKAFLIPTAKEQLNFYASLLEEMGVENPMIEALSLGAVLDGVSFHYIFSDEAYPLEEVMQITLKKYGIDLYA